MVHPLSKESQDFLDAMNRLTVRITDLVTIAGAVTVSNLPATQPISGSVAVSNLPATQPVTGAFWQATQPVSGSVSVSNLPASQPVTGTFWPVTQPVSGSITTITPTSATATITASATITTVAVKIIAANPNRRGLSFYNNSANSVYLKLGAAGNAGTDMSFILATFAHLSLNQLFPGLIYTGEVWGIRNAGTGQVVATELT